MENSMPLQVNLEYGQFFNHGDKYHVSFDYSSEKQKQEMKKFFENILPTYGANGSFQKEGHEYIIPYFVDENGRQIYSSNVIGGTSIPEEFLANFIKRFIEVEKATIKVGNVSITGEIEDELLNTIVHSIGPKLEKSNSHNR